MHTEQSERVRQAMLIPPRDVYLKRAPVPAPKDQPKKAKQ